MTPTRTIILKRDKIKKEACQLKENHCNIIKKEKITEPQKNTNKGNKNIKSNKIYPTLCLASFASEIARWVTSFMISVKIKKFLLMVDNQFLLSSLSIIKALNQTKPRQL
ncbi:MAG: hypothetical protein K0R24_603 [Gammaproteobacteria bacterium]|nr:hypothetical protein [Gammaproteobacteria bacterium]